MQNWAAAATTALASYPFIAAALRYLRHQKLLALPPPTDLHSSQAVISLGPMTDFPFLYRKSLEFALLKTYAIPSISKVLVATRELSHRCPKRYDDTDLLISHFTEEASDSPAVQLAIQRINHLHAKYRLSNQDYLYVLAVFVVEPIRWISRYGFRRLLPQEIQWSGSSQTTDLFLSKTPKLAHPFARKFVGALCPKRLRRAIAFSDPPGWMVRFADGLLKFVFVYFQGWFLVPRWNPLRRTEASAYVCPPATVASEMVGVSMKPRYNVLEMTYPNGYCINDLGPVKFVGDAMEVKK
ncbi:hypothetical protein HDU98_010344 [Podochytrium sp. JEL0797]|nr:hypothetical protein HDU98_010344 [Podochytrium sp. JEL0797]